MRQVSFSYPAADYNVIAATQNITTSTGGYVLLNGDYAFYQPGGGGLRPSWASLPGGIQRTIGIFATGDLSAVVFFASGLDTNGRVVTASFAGPSGGSAGTATDCFATFTAEFAQVNALFCTSAATVMFTAGIGATGSTRWVMMDLWKNPFNVVGTVVTATIASVTPQTTNDDPNTSTAPVVFNHATGALTANTVFSQTVPARFMRYVGTTNSATGVVSTLSFQQIG